MGENPFWRKPQVRMRKASDTGKRFLAPSIEDYSRPFIKSTSATDHVLSPISLNIVVNDAVTFVFVRAFWMGARINVKGRYEVRVNDVFDCAFDPDHPLCFRTPNRKSSFNRHVNHPAGP